MALDLLKRLSRSLRRGAEAEGELRWRALASLDRGRLGEARLALDHRGRGVALWENAGSLWKMPMGPSASPALVRLPFGEGTSPRLALNTEGRGLALWVAEIGDERQIVGKTIGNGDGPGLSVFRTPGKVHQLQVAVDRRGNALAAWLHEKVGRMEVMTQSFDLRNETWEAAPAILGLPSDPAAAPQLCANHREHAMVLWSVQDGAFEGLMASHYWPSDRIWSDRPVPVVSRAARFHQVAMDDLGNALAVWVHAPYGKRQTLEASYYDGQRGEWGEPEVLSSAQIFTSPRLQMNGAGQALVAWCQRESGGAQRLFAKGFRDRAWEPQVEPLDHSHDLLQDFAIDLAEDGRAGVIIVQRGPDGDHVSARTRKQGWGPPRALAANPGAVCGAPRIALCPQGLSAIWIQGVGLDRTLFLADAVEPQPPRSS